MFSFDSLKTFCFFVGGRRSGKSIVANLIDAHPQAIIANNYNILEIIDRAGVKRNNLLPVMALSSLQNRRSERPDFISVKRGVYPIKLEGQFKKDPLIQVMGDNLWSSNIFFKDYSADKITQRVEILKSSLAIPVKCIYLIRNPYDMIGGEPSLMVSFKKTLRGIKILKNLFKDQFLPVYYEELLNNPETEFQRILDFLGLEFRDDYQSDVVDLLYKPSRKNKSGVIWFKGMEDKIEKMVGDVVEYQRYFSPKTEYPVVQKKVQISTDESVVVREFVVSGRNIGPNLDVLTALHNRYHRFGGVIKSVYACVWNHFSPLYGGRSYAEVNSLSEKQIYQLRDKGIFLDIPLSNDFFTLEDYKASKSLLKKFHIEGNAVICVNDELARMVRNDFPKYSLRASMIKDIQTPQAITEALSLYDHITLRMTYHDNKEFLQSIAEKEQVILFANSKCEYHCEMNCLKPFSKRIKKDKFTPLKCWRKEHNLPITPYMEFDLSDRRFRGFKIFKLEPEFVYYPAGR